MKSFAKLFCVVALAVLLGFTSTASAQMVAWELDHESLGVSKAVVSVVPEYLGAGVYELAGFLSYRTIVPGAVEQTLPVDGVGVVFSGEVQIALSGADLASVSDTILGSDISISLNPATLNGTYIVAITETTETTSNLSEFFSGNATFVGTPNRNYMFSGDYLAITYHSNTDEGAAEAAAYELAAYGDGTGLITVEAGWLPSVDIPFTYTVYQDGRIVQESTLPDETDSGGKGIMSWDGSVSVGTDDDDTDNVFGLEFTLKKSSGKTDASLDGEYVSVGFYSGTDGSNPAAARTLATFNGDGTGTVGLLSHSETELPEISFTYLVADDGTLTHEYTYPDETVSSGEGIVSVDDSVVAIVDNDTADGIVGFEIGIKKSSGMSNADLQGTFVSIGYYAVADGSYAGTQDVTLVFNGDGTGTVYFPANGLLEGVSDSLPFTYTVAEDGTFSHAYTLPDETVAGGAGIVSPDGTIIASVDDDPSDSLIGIELGVKLFR